MKGICFIKPLFELVTQKKKIETRRVITPQPLGVYCLGLQEDGRFKFADPAFHDYEYIRPRYQIGDKVYLKEPYFQLPVMFENQTTEIIYRYNDRSWDSSFSSINISWSNKLFMPESAARYWIEITNVFAERLQDIGRDSCIFEGIQDNVTLRPNNIGYKHRYTNMVDTIEYINAIDAYRALINKIDGKGTWESNPWVFVYDFKLTTKP